METFRCQICVGVLVDPTARRCPHCRHNQRRRRPIVLGEATRIGATALPIDRWMIERLNTEGSRRSRQTLPPVAWHGKFTTSPLAEPDFSATPSPVATPFAPPAGVQPVAAPPEPLLPPEEPARPATVGALALDVYTRPLTSAPEREAELEPPDVAPVPALAKPTPLHELAPDVRTLVEELYEQARAELSGNDLAFFMPIEHDDDEEDVGPPDLDAPTTDPRPPSGSGWVPAFQTQPRRRGHRAAD